ncbi:MAG TPA: hypothetical protein VEY07_05825 [Thermoplasmata archaeon]|nr:hypothetical protein [Thermoplasmata archaeon]
MSGPESPENPRPPRTPPAADEEWAEAYSEGYGEGLREALREMLQHASRGHTAQELRLLVESRLARLREDVDLKRKSLLSPPRRAQFGAMLRPAIGSAPPPSAPGLQASTSYLLFEERPDRALSMLRAGLARYPRAVIVSFHPPDLPPDPTGHIVVLRVGVPNVGGPTTDGSLPATVVAGRIREAAAGEGGALVYVDALEVLATGDGGVDGMLRFVQFAAGEVARNPSALIVSVGPHSFDERTKSLLQRSFNIVL